MFSAYGTNVNDFYGRLDPQVTVGVHYGLCCSGSVICRTPLDVKDSIPGDSTQAVQLGGTVSASFVLQGFGPYIQRHLGRQPCFHIGRI